MYKCQTNSDWKSAENYKRIIKYNKVNLMTFILFLILTTSARYIYSTAQWYTRGSTTVVALNWISNMYYQQILVLFRFVCVITYYSYLTLNVDFKIHSPKKNYFLLINILYLFHNPHLCVCSRSLWNEFCAV